MLLPCQQQVHLSAPPHCQRPSHGRDTQHSHVPGPPEPSPDSEVRPDVGIHHSGSAPVDKHTDVLHLPQMHTEIQPDAGTFTQALM